MLGPGGVIGVTAEPVAARPDDPPPPPPSPVSTSNLWDLHADPSALRLAVGGYHSLATALRSNAEGVSAAGKRIYDGPWEGDAAESYNRHRVRITGDITHAGELFDRAADALEATANALVTAQSALTASLGVVTAQCPADVTSDSVTFRPRDAADLALVKRAIKTAREVRADLDIKLRDDAAELGRVVPQLANIAAAWRSVAEGTLDPFVMPPEIPGVGTIYDFANNRFIVSTGPGNDTVEVRIDPATGQRVVVINGVDYQVPEGMALTVRTSAGNDTVTVPPGTRINFTVLGGEGDDKIDGGDGTERILGGDGLDTIKAGAGNDRVSGGADRDYIDGQGGDDTLTGGTGDDTIYGLSGNDHISGGDGRDYLEGATGNDTIDGGADNDMISGGRDGDTIDGGGGSDVIYAGDGSDTVRGGTGNDTAYTQTDDHGSDVERTVTIEIRNVGTTININGSPEFVERVQADLDMLRSSPDGQAMLEAMDRVHTETGAIAKDWPILGGIAYQGDTVTITETTDENGYAGNDNNVLERVAGHDNYRVQYNPTFDTNNDGPPVTVLFHEMAHVYDFHNDTTVDGSYNNPDDPDQMVDDDGNVVGVPNSERQAAGLPIDADGDGDYEIDPDHPYQYTENGLRDELGAPHRPKYGF